MSTTPTIKCPNCKTVLCEEEVANKECWSCVGASIKPSTNTSEYDPEIDDETQD
jgi:hypothetical protein